MKKDIKISVIVPVYNVELWLEECLESIINQTLKDIEIICVNDASTDSSLNILKMYQTKDDRIKIIDLKENKRLGYARNRAIEIARGKYVYFIDADDYLVLEGLEIIYKKCEEEKLEFIFFDEKNFCDSSMEGIIEIKDVSRKHHYQNDSAGIDLLLAMLNNEEYYAYVHGQMVLRRVLIDNDIRFIEGYYHEDESYTIKVLCNVKRAGYINKSIYMRRIRIGSIMTSNLVEERIKGWFLAVYELVKYCILKNINYREIQERIILLSSQANNLLKKNNSGSISFIEQEYQVAYEIWLNGQTIASEKKIYYT